MSYVWELCRIAGIMTKLSSTQLVPIQSLRLIIELLRYVLVQREEVRAVQLNGMFVVVFGMWNVEHRQHSD